MASAMQRRVCGGQRGVVRRVFACLRACFLRTALFRGCAFSETFLMQAVIGRSALAVGIAFSLATASLSALALDAAGQPEVVVTANRSPVTADETLASVSVITRDDIEANASNDLLDLLRNVPGLDIVRGGGLGQQTSVFLRGTNSNHALVLIDGVRVAALGTGAFAWEQLAIGQIERIEVVRGPRAALWGSDAIGGVIQIFTRRSVGFDGALSLGNHGTWGAEAGGGVRNERGGFDLRLGYADADGINAQSPDGFSFDPDDDGYVYRNAMLHGDLAVGTQRLEAMASRRDNDIEFDQGESETRQAQYSLALNGALRDDWTHHLAIAQARDTLVTPAFFSRYDSRREQADWNHTLSLAARSELLFGVAYVRERGDNIDTFGGDPIYSARRSNRAGFLAWRGGTGAHDFEASARHDDSSTFGGESTFAGAWGWNLGDALRSTLSIGEGFRAPTLNELYSPGFGGLFAGNPLLDPERSRSVEAGLDIDVAANTTLAISAYRNEVRDLIDFSGGDTFQAINIKRVRIDGIELDAGWSLDAWSVDANATWQDAEDRDTGAALLRRPARKATVVIDRRFASGARLGVEGYVASRRPDFGGDLGGYGTLSLRGRLPLTAGWNLDARVENLLDRDYVLVSGFNTPGMTALLTLRWGDAE
jgi:vitamin B12 transporter